MHSFSVAIVDSNVLAGMGLQQILEDLIPVADIRIFTSFEELVSCEEKNFVHFFVASRIYFEHAQFFRENATKSFVLVNGDMQINGVMTLNVCQTEKMLIKDILALHGTGHGRPGAHPGQGHPGGHPGGHPDNIDMKQAHKSMPPSFMQHANMPSGHPHHETRPASTPQELLLSAREIEVAVLLSKGFINKEIANKLNISITTVITHRTHIMEKLHARSLADIIIYCVMNGLVDVGDL
ncbi:MAG: helix-turn-helix transcriptional regulator [Bacteroidaceae bacterium]|nr:helix-turn-helix transcriptional regulator [Bacteroidaceae bacterium]